MIPKIIHYCWFGHGPLPESAKKCIESWRRFCPDYEIKEWNESNYDVTSNAYMREAYEKKRYAFVSDYVRLDIIYRYGGIYLDTDVEIIKNMDPLLNQQAFCGVENGTRYIALGLGFGAEKGNQCIMTMRDDYEKRHFVKNGVMDLTPAPKIHTQALAREGYIFSEGIHRFKDLVVFPPEFFSPICFETGDMKILENTFSIHHYDCSWYSDAEKSARVIRKKLVKVLPHKAAGRVAYFIAQCKHYGLKNAMRRSWSRIKNR